MSGVQFTYGNAGEGHTPNVLVKYFTGAATATNSGLSIWQAGYGDLTNIIFGKGARAFYTARDPQSSNGHCGFQATSHKCPSGSRKYPA